MKITIQTIIIHIGRKTKCLKTVNCKQIICFLQTFGLYSLRLKTK